MFVDESHFSTEPYVVRGWHKLPVDAAFGDHLIGGRDESGLGERDCDAFLELAAVEDLLDALDLGSLPVKNDRGSGVFQPQVCWRIHVTTSKPLGDFPMPTLGGANTKKTPLLLELIHLFQHCPLRYT